MIYSRTKSDPSSFWHESRCGAKSLWAETSFASCTRGRCERRKRCFADWELSGLGCGCGPCWWKSSRSSLAALGWRCGLRCWASRRPGEATTLGCQDARPTYAPRAAASPPSAPRKFPHQTRSRGWWICVDRSARSPDCCWHLACEISSFSPSERWAFGACNDKFASVNQNRGQSLILRFWYLNTPSINFGVRVYLRNRFLEHMCPENTFSEHLCTLVSISSILVYPEYRFVA